MLLINSASQSGLVSTETQDIARQSVITRIPGRELKGDKDRYRTDLRCYGAFNGKVRPGHRRTKFQKNRTLKAARKWRKHKRWLVKHAQQVDVWDFWTIWNRLVIATCRRRKCKTKWEGQVRALPDFDYWSADESALWRMSPNPAVEFAKIQS